MLPVKDYLNNRVYDGKRYLTKEENDKLIEAAKRQKESSDKYIDEE